MSGHLEKLRTAELEAVRPWFKAGARILEIGGGSGFQASQLASLGCEVVSLDVSESSERGRYHPVQLYDGVHIPFPNGSFDVVFSSNVLEHVHALPQLLQEIQRVLDGAGIAIHILPTPAWRFWTSLAHYPFLVKYALRLNRLSGDSCVPPLKEGIGRRSIGYALRRALIAGPHGEFPSAVSELWYFSRRHWLRIFQTAGNELLCDFPTGLFYSGYCLFPGLSIARRRMLSRLLGSSCRIFVLRFSPPVRKPAD